MFTKDELITALQIIDSVETGEDKFTHWQRDLIAKIRAEIYKHLRSAPNDKSEIPF